MDIYGVEMNQTVTFRAYDASTGTLYPEVVVDPEIKFEPFVLKGTYSDPMILTANDKIEQSTELKEGWNWISFYVNTGDMTVASLLEKIADDVVTIKSQYDGYLSYENNKWGGSLTGALSNVQMYAVKMKSDRTLRIVGQPVDPSSNQITVKEGWNWVGYYDRQVASVTDAFADMDPVNGDVVKGQYGVTYYDSIEWAGSLLMMEPGAGYVVKSIPSADRTFGYPGAITSHAPSRIQTRDASAGTGFSSSNFQPVDFRKYSGNAIMAARVMNGNVPMTNVEIAVFADGECRTVAGN